jgi:hypothetical protein
MLPDEDRSKQPSGHSLCPHARGGARGLAKTGETLGARGGSVRGKVDVRDSAAVTDP